MGRGSGTITMAAFNPRDQWLDRHYPASMVMEISITS
jgi:hypothetical protein